MADQTAAMRPAIRMNPAGLGDILRDVFFQYTPPLPFTFTAGNETLQQVIPILSDSHFICCSTTYTNSAESWQSGAAPAVPYFTVTNGGATVQLTDGGNNQFLSNFPVPLSSLFGNGKEPFIWPFTHLFRANTPITVAMAGMAAAAPFAGQIIRVVFNGFKIPKGSLPSLGL